MATELITGKLGTPHVGSEDIGAFNAYTIGKGVIVLNGCTCTLTSANTARIADGDLVFDGRHFRIMDFEDVAIKSGTPGMLRNDLIVIHYEKDADGIESASLISISGTSYEAGTAAPETTYIKASVLDGAMSADYPLYSIQLNGVSVSAPKPLYQNWSTLIDGFAKIENNKADKSHTHAASNITSGVLSVERGGTGGSTIRGAAHSLQVLSLSRSVSISSGGNLNAIIEPGSYNSGSQAITETLVNVPDGVRCGFRLNVYDIMGVTADSNYILQELVYYPNGRHYYRYRNSNNVWSLWCSNMLNIDGVGIAQGGTGATNRANAINNLVDLGVDPVTITADDTLESWQDLGYGVAWFTRSVLEKQPYATGSLFNFPKPNKNVITQLFHCGTQGNLCLRGIDADGIGDWRTILDSKNVPSRVTSKGSSGNWIWYRYSDGWVRQICRIATTMACGANWGNGFYNPTPIAAGDYPVTLKASTYPRVQASVISTEGRYLVTLDTTGTLSKAPKAYICSMHAQSSQSTVQFQLMVEGWAA